MQKNITHLGISKIVPAPGNLRKQIEPDLKLWSDFPHLKEVSLMVIHITGLCASDPQVNQGIPIECPCYSRPRGNVEHGERGVLPSHFPFSAPRLTLFNQQQDALGSFFTLM